MKKYADCKETAAKKLEYANDEWIQKRETLSTYQTFYR